MLKEKIDYALGEKELVKFFSLLDLKGDNSKLNMPRCFVDTVWHEKLEDQKSYDQFCLEHVGEKLQHVEDQGFGELEWVNDYEQKYGKLPPIWFSDEEGNVNKDLFHKYIESGEVTLEWVCNVIVTTP